jgi:hypothetical protein
MYTVIIIIVIFVHYWSYKMLCMDDTTGDIDCWMVYRDHLSFYEWSNFNDVLIRFTVTICLFINEVIWMKYWSVLLWRVFKLLLSIAFYFQVNYVKPKCFPERNISLLFIGVKYSLLHGLSCEKNEEKTFIAPVSVYISSVWW